METYTVFKDVAIILIMAKLFGIIARKCKAPQVVGEIIAGLVIGPALLGWVDVEKSTFLPAMAEIGVVILMFSAGLETNLKELVKTGPIALVIALAGVFIPLAGGTALYMAYYGFAAPGTDEFIKALFIGTIMTATSVGITVQVLREMGYLKGKIGTTILSAAIIDDIIGIIVLTFVIGMKSPDADPGKVVLSTLLFFALSLIGGFILYKIFKRIDSIHPHTRRIAILGLAFCFGLSYVAERYFGIADITGAFVAGIILCNIRDSEYIAGKMDINSYMIFGPLFFASIGLKTNISGFTMDILWFSLLFVAVALLTKVIGCGLISRLFRFKTSDSIKIGIGMMTRGEVALIVSQKGLSAGIMDPVFFTSVILLIIVSSILTPILLKIMFSKYPETQ